MAKLFCSKCDNFFSKLVLFVIDYIAQGTGTKFDKVELLELREFAYFSNNRITIAPTMLTKPGRYPFILRALNN